MSEGENIYTKSRNVTVGYIGVLTRGILPESSSDDVIVHENINQKLVNEGYSTKSIEIASGLNEFCRQLADDDYEIEWKEVILVISVPWCESYLLNTDEKDMYDTMWEILAKLEVRGVIFYLVPILNDNHRKGKNEPQWQAIKRQLIDRCRYADLFMVVNAESTLNKLVKNTIDYARNDQVYKQVIELISDRISKQIISCLQSDHKILNPIEETLSKINRPCTNKADHKLLDSVFNLAKLLIIERSKQKCNDITAYQLLQSIENYIDRLIVKFDSKLISQDPTLLIDILTSIIPDSNEIQILGKDNKRYYRSGWTFTRVAQTLNLLDHFGFEPDDFKSKKILEIGPGLGDFYKIARYFGCSDVTVCEKNIIFLLIAKYNGCNTLEINIERDGLSILPENEFDLFWCKGLLNAFHFNSENELFDIISPITKSLKRDATALWFTYNTYRPGAASSELDDPIGTLENVFCALGWKRIDRPELIQDSSYGLDYLQRVNTLFFSRNI